MLLKLFGSKTSPPNNPPLEKPLILQIIHAGGIVERYYMAFPASWIMDKYPNFVLARPHIFRQPWDAIVQADEILVPGQKYFVVPIRTLKKLRRRPTVEASSNGLISQDEDYSAASISKSVSLGKPKPCVRRVRFKGIEPKARNDSGVAQEGNRKKNSNGKGFRKKNVQFAPSLTIINETRDVED